MARFEALLKGKTLGDRYLLEAWIGSGNMGAVFRARDKQLGRLVAVKVLSFASGPDQVDERLRRWFRREAKVASQLDHPNVVPIYDCGVDARLGLDYLVMKLLSGADLAKYLADRGPPPPEVALALFRQAVRGVAAGHRIGLVHRDIKPQNLFVTAEDGEELQLFVLDFGIALATFSSDTFTQLEPGVLGPCSPGYAAPEQLTDATVTAACDVFSLAATAVELFTGSRMAPPGEVAGSEQAIRRAHDLLAAHAHAIPAGVARILHRALSFSPAARFPDASALAAALDCVAAAPPAPRWVAAAPAEAPRPVAPEPAGTLPRGGPATVPSMEPARPRTRRMPRRLVAGVLVAAVLLGGASLWQSGSGDTAPEVQAPMAASIAATASALMEDSPDTAGLQTAFATPDSLAAPVPDSASAPVRESDPAPPESSAERQPATAPAASAPVPAPVDSSAIHYDRGSVLLGQRNYAEAERSFRAAIRLQPDNASYHSRLGHTLERQQRYADAESSFRESARLRPFDAATHQSLGRLQFRQGRYREAEASYRAMVRLQPGWAEHHWNLGETLSRQERYPEAEASYREAIRIYPTAHYHHSLALALVSQYRHAEAERSFREAVRLRPADASLRHSLGQLLGIMRRWDESIAQMEEAVRLEPGNAQYREDLGTTRRAVERSRPRLGPRVSCNRVEVQEKGCVVIFDRDSGRTRP
ncbi:MAG TPA: tetratricopeptide repeat protein [Longimicrobium sp.]